VLVIHETTLELEMSDHDHPVIYRYRIHRHVTKPKSKGGLGVIKLRLQNDALLMKNLHNFFNKEDLV
jgi:hypothetical protein